LLFAICKSNQLDWLQVITASKENMLRRVCVEVRQHFQLRLWCNF